MANLKYGNHCNLKTNVMITFLTGFLIMTYIYLMTALLLELVELPVMIVPPTSPFMEAIGQQKHIGN